MLNSATLQPGEPGVHVFKWVPERRHTVCVFVCVCTMYISTSMPRSPCDGSAFIGSDGLHMPLPQLLFATLSFHAYRSEACSLFACACVCVLVRPNERYVCSISFGLFNRFTFQPYIVVPFGAHECGHRPLRHIMLTNDENDKNPAQQIATIIL